MVQKEILIVNDGSLILKMMGLLLEGKGHRVNLTETSEDGLIVLSTRNIGLVVLKLNGASPGRRALAPMVKELNPHAALVVISDNEYLPAEFFEIEVDEYIIEPCRAVELWRRLLCHLDKEEVAVPAPADLGLMHPLNHRLVHNMGLMFHDLRSLVVSINSGLKLLQRKLDGAMDPDLEVIFQETVAKTQAMSNVAEEFLGKFQKNDFPDQEHPWVDLGKDVIEPVLAEMQADFRRRGLTLDNRMCLVPAAGRTVRGDCATLKSIFRNIISNAVKYGSPGGVIAIDHDTDPVYFRLRVHNSGSPLSPESREEMFIRREPGRRSSQGMGLGLYLGREVMRSHGGDIVCEPDPRGANFVMTMPLA